MGSKKQSILTILVTIFLMVVGTIAYTSKPSNTQAFSFKPGKVDLVIIEEESILDTSKNQFIKTYTFKNNGDKSGDLCIYFSYYPKEKYLDKNIDLIKILEEKKEIYQNNLDIYNINKQDPLKIGELPGFTSKSYSFYFYYAQKNYIDIELTAILS